MSEVISITLKDIAARAGVSVSTVSRVINKNDTKAAGKEVRDKIWSLARENGYVPNNTAQSLRLGKNDASPSRKSIGCIFARTSNTMDDPFFSQLFRYVEFEAIKSGYSVGFSLSAYEIDDKELYKNIHLGDVEGVIVLGRYSKSLLEFLKSNYSNVIFTGLNSIQDNYDQIICDGYKAAVMAVKHLHSLGHKNIGYIGEQYRETRFNGYYDTMKSLGLQINEHHMVNANLSIKGGYDGANQIIASGPLPTAIFCANDNTAIGTIKALLEAGISIPQQISVIGIDNIEMCQYITPMLTSIDIPKHEMGKFAVKTLIDRIENGHKLPVKIDIPCSIVSRESCMQLKK